MKSPELWKPTKFEISKGKVRASRDLHFVNYAERIIADSIGEVMTEWIPQYVHGSLGDIGCGNVPLYQFYKPFCEKCITVDWENTIHPNPHIDIFADLNSGHIPDMEPQSLDSVICTDVLEHLYEPRNLIAEISRLLKKDGVALFTVPFIFWIHEEPFDFYRYTPFSLRKMMEDQGLKVLEIKSLGAAPEVIAMLISIAALYGLGWFGKIIARMYTSLPAFLYAIPGIKKAAVKNADFMCLGFAVAVQKEN